MPKLWPNIRDHTSLSSNSKRRPLPNLPALRFTKSKDDENMNPFCYKRTKSEIKQATRQKRPLMRIKPLPREKAAIIILRRKWGYTVTALAAWSGRSTSYIHRILNKNATLGILHYGNLRKIPNRIRQMAKRRMENNLRIYGEAWMMWLEGIGEKPP
jgi:hypothetical protein